jgi:tetratricopeptide (TPR) repeat protein
MLLKAAEDEGNSERKFLLFLTLAVQCAKAGEYAKIAEYSKKAALLKPDDLLANFILAQAQERMGAGEEALKAYEAALRDPMARSPQLKDFISAQIMRVKTEGPRKGSKFQGLRYMTW